MAEEAPSGTVTKVLVVDDHRVVRDGLASILRDAGYAVLLAGDGEEAVATATSARPELVLMDVLMPGMSGIDATRLITARDPAIRVVMLSVADSPETVRTAVEAGASGYLAKEATSGELLLDVLRRTATGERVFVPANLAHALEAETTSQPLDSDALTAREREVAALAATGTANSEIGSLLGISHRTVEGHLARAYKKLGVTSRTELARLAANRPIVEYRQDDQDQTVLLAEITYYSALPPLKNRGNIKEQTSRESRTIHRELRFRLLGPFEVRTAEGWQPIAAGKWRALLATLLLNQGRTVSVDTLIDAIWGDEPPTKAANLVSIYVLRLRRLLGDREGRLLVTRAPGYFIRIEPDEVDVARFERLAGEGRRMLAADPEPAAAILREALELWRGDVLADIPLTPYIEAEAERLSELRRATTQLRIEADLACGRSAQVIPELRGMLAGNPLHERLWLLLMSALDNVGRHTEALDAYAQAREAIADQLGVDPGAELRRLYGDLRAAGNPTREFVEKPLGMTDQSQTTESPKVHQPILTPPARAASETAEAPVTVADELSEVPGAYSRRPPAQLPADIGDFTGRAEHLTQLRDMLSARGAASLRTAPAVIVTGSGGTGKTSLAVHAAHQVLAHYPDGQLYIDLLGNTPHPLAAADVQAQFLRSLGLEASQVPVGAEERAALYQTRVAARRVLILLDNAHDAAQVRPLLPESPTCAVLMTARNRMRDLTVAHMVDLDALDDDESLALFTGIVGARRVTAEPEATAEVLFVCAGLPLAIRICAARLAARSRWSIQTLAARLRAHLDTLDGLNADGRGVKVSFQASFEALPVNGVATRAFRFLGLWQGRSISLRAATALLRLDEDETADALETLVDACLLESPSPDKYRLHDLLWAWASEQALTEETEQDQRAGLERLLRWYLHSADLAAQAIGSPRTRPPVPQAPADMHLPVFPDANVAMDWLEAERGNLVEATRQAAELGLDDIAWLLPASATVFFSRRGYYSDWIASHETALSSLRRTGDRKGEAQILNNLGMAYAELDLDAAVGYLRHALKIHRSVEDLRGEAETLSGLLYTYGRWRQFQEAIALHAKTVESHHRAGLSQDAGVVLNNLAEAYLGLGMMDEAMRCLRQAQQIFHDTVVDSWSANILDQQSGKNS